jgi:hypothetical protein
MDVGERGIETGRFNWLSPYNQFATQWVGWLIANEEESCIATDSFQDA